MGLVVAELVHPTKYTSLSMEKAIATLVKQEQEKVDSLATKEESLSQMWKQIPFFAVDTDESKSEKMQLLHGTGPITNKIKEMINTNTEDFRIYGSISDFHRMYHADVFDMTQDMAGNIKMIISPSLAKTPEFLQDLESDKIKVVPSNTDSICVIINDKKEALIFMRNTTHPTRQLFAWWSDSDTLIDMMVAFFELSWEKGESLY